MLSVVNLSQIDLNLLLVLHAVLQHGSVAAAAQALHVTPSAVSNALARLRVLLADPLFVRRGRGLVPTPRAQELAPLLAMALAGLEHALGDHEPFVAGRSTRELTIAMADGDQVASLPAIARTFMRELPKARLRVVSIDALLASGGLAGVLAELAIAPHIPDPELHWQPLYEENAVVIARRDHPRLPRGRQLSKEQFHASRHVDTHLALGKPGVVHRAAEDMFARAGLERDIAVVVPSFSAAAMIVACTDLLAAIPRRVALALCEQLPLRSLELSVEAPAFPMGLVWHQRVHEDSATRYVCDLITRTLQTSKPLHKAPRKSSTKH